MAELELREQILGISRRGIKNEPALNLMPSTSNGSSAANILTSLSRNRSVASAGSAFALRTNQAVPFPVDASLRADFALRRASSGRPESTDRRLAR